MGIVKDMTETDVHNANLHKGKEKKLRQLWKLFSIGFRNHFGNYFETLEFCGLRSEKFNFRWKHFPLKL